MTDFVKGLDLCEMFFHEAALPILQQHYPHLEFSAGLLGYGSDVLGFDDSVSTDHMWGPRFYLFLRESDIHLKDALMALFAAHLPYTFKGFSVNFSDPDPTDGGVRHAKLITSGTVSPLIWIHTIEAFACEYLGLIPQTARQWLSVSEHRLLGFTCGKLFADGLDVKKLRHTLSFYPTQVKLYLLASQWALIGEEQAFVKRCGSVGDEIGSRLVCARIAERLMRLCFLYHNQYAPYSKWFGTAFARLPIDGGIKNEIDMALSAPSVAERESHIVAALVLTAKLHNESGLTEPVSTTVKKYFGRDIDVISTDKIVDQLWDRITEEGLKQFPPVGTLSQVANFVALSDNPAYIGHVQNLYARG